MSKSRDREEAKYWEPRVFRNTFTYRGRRRQVAGWHMKVQWERNRRTLRLRGHSRAEAAREAAGMYRQLRRGGWPALEQLLNVGNDGESSAALDRSEPSMAQVVLRKYVGNLNAGYSRELFAALTYRGRTEHVALGTEDTNEARLRSAELQRELGSEGWSRMKLVHSWEATVAVFWQADPMTCTYTTLLTHPAAKGTLPVISKPRGWRVLIVEPDGGVRRALSYWLSQHPAVGRVEGTPVATDVAAPESWGIVLANREQPAAVLRETTASPGARTPRLLTHGVFLDSDAIFASFSGVSRGYLLRRVPPADLLEPLLPAYPEGPPRKSADEDRQVARHFQSLFEPVGARPPQRAADLTTRELEILDLLSRGFADKEIGGELEISVWTVHSHLKRIFAKYGVRTRTEAVVKHLQK